MALVMAGGLFAAASPAHACLNLGMSDVAFGKEAATAAAWSKLEEYAATKARARGWSRTKKSNARFVNCEVYLDLGVATEYRCLVRATYCPAG